MKNLYRGAYTYAKKGREKLPALKWFKLSILGNELPTSHTEKGEGAAEQCHSRATIRNGRNTGRDRIDQDVLATNSATEDGDVATSGHSGHVD